MIRRLSIISVVLWATIYITGCGRTVVTEDRGIEDLGTLGGENSSGQAINNDGTVTGNSVKTGDLASGRLHAFRYVDGQGMVDVGTLVSGGGNVSFWEGINNRGIVCGVAPGSNSGSTPI